MKESVFDVLLTMNRMEVDIKLVYTSTYIIHYYVLANLFIQIICLIYYQCIYIYIYIHIYVNGEQNIVLVLVPRVDSDNY